MSKRNRITEPPRRIEVTKTTYLTRLSGKTAAENIYVYTDLNGKYLPCSTEIQRGRKIGRTMWQKVKEDVGQSECMNDAWGKKVHQANIERTSFLALTKDARIQLAGDRIAEKYATEEG